MAPSLSVLVELLLAALLATTLIYCVKLERGLRRLREDQENLNATVRALNTGIAAAHASLAGLKAAAKDAGETLSTKVGGARALADELGLLVSSGDRIASRIESAIERPNRTTANKSLGDSLRALR